MKKKVQSIMAASAFAAFSATAALGATTPYDLIRPTWPLSWDAKVFENFDTTITKKTGMLPKEATPASFKAGELMPDTLDQAYLDAINTKISPIRVNQAGYLKKDPERQFYYVGDATEFEVVDANGKSLSTKVTGTLTPSGITTSSDWTIVAGTDASTNDKKRYQVDITGPSGKILVGKIPQSVPTDKRLRIKVGDNISSTFIISDDIYTMAKDASLKFFGIQRSGNSESWFHGPSHVKDGGGKFVSGRDDVTGFTPKESALQGGWYDSGDHLKESQTQAFTFMALAVMSATNPAKDVDHYAYNHAEFVKTDGIPDVLREAKHGADFFLRAYNFANGIIDNMAVSVGNFGADHGFWSRPEIQDAVPASLTGRGGPAERDIRLGELGSNISGMIAAGLAILSKDYAKYDKNFADSCLMVAEKMYDFAKNLKLKEKSLGPGTYDGGKEYVYNTKADGWSSAAYNGNNESHDDLAIAAIALHYATYEKTGKMDYLNDAVKDTDISVEQEASTGFFHGGWMAWSRDGMRKSSKNTSWANAYTYTLYGFYKMLLKDKETGEKYGIDDKTRLTYAENVALVLGTNISYLSGNGSKSITIPTLNGTTPITFGDLWYNMQTDQTWVYNCNQIGNIFEVLAYSDVTKDLESVKLPQKGVLNWNSEAMKQFGINQLNYMFGVNPWDISFVYDVGDKNDAHPHHRAANPEGRNTPGLNYKYVRPAGALLGGVAPNTINSWKPSTLNWEDYQQSEVRLDGSVILLSALTIVSNGGDDYYEKKCDKCKTGDATPLAEDAAYAAAFHYTSSDSDTINIRVSNESLDKLDSVVAYIYFDAPEDYMSAYELLYKVDTCQTSGLAGFNRPCAESIASQKLGEPQKVEDSFNKDKNTYSWSQPIFLGDLDVGSQIMIELVVNTTSKFKATDSWSFTAHTATKNAPAYSGIPKWSATQGEIQEAPKDPYIVLRSKGKLLWGYGPGKTTSDRVGIVKVTDFARAHMQASNNKLYVLATAQGTKTVKIFDVLGNQLLAQTFSGTSAQVDLANLPHRGAMVARLMSGNKLLATKAIRIK